jgi:hypothetical protein
VLSAREAVTSLYGAYRLARRDTGGLDYFNTSLEGFWRSFYAAAFIAPPFALLLALRYAHGMVAAGPLRYAAIEVIAYVIAWVAFPVAMLLVARMLDREKHFIRFIVVYNWAAMLQNALYLPIPMMGMTGILTVSAASGLGMVALLLILTYTWFITKTALEVSSSAAAGIVALDLGLGVFITSVADSML